MTSDEVELMGGRANSGRVVRIGDEVARPRYPQTAAVEDFLRYLRANGVLFVPEPLGTDAQGRQRLSYIEGVAPAPPYPEWAFDDKLLLDVARHQRLLHEAARAYRSPQQAHWAESAGDYFPAGADGHLVCHNDLGMSNTIVDAHTKAVVGFIDFDYCRPVKPLFDIAVAARHWVPFGDLDVVASIDVDRVGRFGDFCDIHQLNRESRATVVDFAVGFLLKARSNVRRLADAGNPGFVALIASGYESTNEQTVQWLSGHRGALTGS